MSKPPKRLEHFHRNIPGWSSFAELYREMVASVRGGAHFVEVGSWLGRSAAFMAVEIHNSGKLIRFDCIDAWSDGGPDLAHKVAKMGEPLLTQFLRNTAPVAHLIHAIQSPSADAAALYDDASLDFVMIDASHVYEDVLADIRAWLPKVKSGGVIGFDDFNWSGVRRAITETIGVDNVEVRVNPTKTKTQKGPTRYAIYRVA